MCGRLPHLGGAGLVGFGQPAGIDEHHAFAKAIDAENSPAAAGRDQLPHLRPPVLRFRQSAGKAVSDRAKAEFGLQREAELMFEEASLDDALQRGRQIVQCHDE